MDTVLRSLFNHQTQRAALAELVGTFFLTLAALLVPAPYTPFAVGLTLLIFVYGIGDISGSHLNPAVTVGLMGARRFPIGGGLVYIVAQILGAIVARLIAGLVGDVAPDYQAAGWFGEFFGFGFLMLTVAAVYANRIPKAGTGVAIGAALTAGLLTSGGILNPAVAIAMGELVSAATIITLVSGVAFAYLFNLFRDVSPPEVV